MKRNWIVALAVLVVVAGYFVTQQKETPKVPETVKQEQDAPVSAGTRADVKKEVGEAVDAVKEAVADKADEIKKDLTEAAGTAKEAVKEITAEVQDKAVEIAVVAKEAAQETVAEVREKVAETAEAVKEAVQEKSPSSTRR